MSQAKRRHVTRRGLIQAAAAAPFATALATPAIAQGARIFTFAHDEPHDTGYGFLADQFNAKLKETSGGKFSIHEFPGAQLGQEPELAQKVRTGDIDFVINSTANTSTVVPQAGVFSLHFIFLNETHLAKSMLDPGMNALFQEMIIKNTTGAKSLGLLTLGFRKFYSKNEVKSVADMKGKKVRVQATKTEDRFFSAYGAVPVHMPIGQVIPRWKPAWWRSPRTAPTSTAPRSTTKWRRSCPAPTTRRTTTISGSATRRGTASTRRSRAG